MEWSHDFCLSCDRQVYDGAYCSQACRLADLERTTISEPTSPSWHSISMRARVAVDRSVSSGFHLPPAVDFSVYRSRPFDNESTPSSPGQSLGACQTSPSRPSSKASMPDTFRRSSLHEVNVKSYKSLGSSPSRLSLSSLTSAPPTVQALSDQSANYLREYANSFDQVRRLKRHLTLA